MCLKMEAPEKMVLSELVCEDKARPGAMTFVLYAVAPAQNFQHRNRMLGCCIDWWSSQQSSGRGHTLTLFKLHSHGTGVLCKRNKNATAHKCCFL